MEATNEEAPPHAPAHIAFLRAYEFLIWLEQRGVPNASVELFNDGSGTFYVPLGDDEGHLPDDLIGEIVNTFPAMVQGTGRWVQPNPNVIVYEFCAHAMRGEELV